MWSGWPDKDVPTSSTKAIQLIHRVNAGRSSNDVVIVHCSAGGFIYILILFFIIRKEIA
jgi:protein tyrosine phosphatase